MPRTSLLRPSWARIFRTDLRFIVVMFVLLGIIRITGLIRHEINLVVVGFLLMWMLPFVFFDKRGRQTIGLRPPARWGWLIGAFGLGIVAAGLIYWWGHSLYGSGVENWGMTVAREYLAQNEVMSPAIFAVVTLFSMLFSPIGEELFFRGALHEVLATRWSDERPAGLASSAAFALIHIPHHDIVFAGLGLAGLWLPLVLWVGLMFAVSYLFIFARKASGSILGAILCHSGYILGMNLFVYVTYILPA